MPEYLSVDIDAQAFMSIPGEARYLCHSGV